MDIYLDFNVYLSILKREVTDLINYEYILSKLHHFHRYRQDIQFPYSPAHMEEVAVNLKKGDDAKELIENRLKTIEYYSRAYEYLPGLPLRYDIVHQLSQLPSTSELAKTKQELEMLLNSYDNGKLQEHPATRKVFEKPLDCFNRVVEDLDVTGFAHNNDVFHLGRRNKESLENNFKSIQKDCSNIETFEEYQNKYKLGPKRLSSLEPSKIFEIEAVKEALNVFLEENHEYSLTTGNILLSSHNLLERTVTLILNFLEKIGYNQEENNKVVKLRSRMHDVTHAIYGAQADYFVTNDVRFRKKLKATYYFLDLPCKVLSPEEFIRNSFSEKDLEVIILN